MILKKAKTLARRAKKLILPHRIRLTAQDVAPARAYIAGYWQQLERYHPKDDKTLVGLPYPYLVPSKDGQGPFAFNELYYWDSYFMIQGMLNEEQVDFAKGVLENLLTLMQRFHIIPNAARTYFTGRSQPPFLTSFILDIYKLRPDKVWLEKAMAIAKEEYEQVWMGREHPNWRLVYHGLSRYYDVNALHDLAEAESGWDLTTRFGRKALNYLPIDLNALLYKYETDFETSAKILGNTAQADEWHERAGKRKQAVDELMWSNAFGVYFDYNFKKRRRGIITSLASYYPLWAGMASPKQAKQLVRSLHKFDERGGLSTTDYQQFSQFVPGSTPVQWAHPNGWAPLHFLVVEGLKRYGYHKEAERIALRWLKMNLDWFNTHGVFLEKYNVVNPSKLPVDGVYPTQEGFGWTNAVFERFCQDYIDARHK